MCLSYELNCKKNAVLISLITLFLWPIFTYAFDSFVIQEIRLDGIQRTDINTIFTNLPIKVGDYFSETETQNIIHQLYQTNLFDDVKIYTEEKTIIIVINERPIIESINFKGMKNIDSYNISNDFFEDINFREGYLFNKAKLAYIEQEFKKYYLKRGYYNIKISTNIEYIANNRVNINFDIFEGCIAKVCKISLVGNDLFNQNELLSLFQTTTSNWMTWYTHSNIFSHEKLENDIESLRSYYLDRGYLDFFIRSLEVSISPDRKDIYIIINIHEGQPYTIHNIKISGDLFSYNKEIKKLISVKNGELFKLRKVNNSIKSINDFFGEKGFAFVNSSPDMQLNRTRHEVDLNFHIKPGNRVYVNRINISGNKHTRDLVIRREMQQQESALYNVHNIQNSCERIERLGFFNEINMKAEPVPGIPDQIDLNLTIKEKPTGMINVGIGYGSSEKAIFSAGINEDNIFGSGNNLTLRLNTSRNNRLLSFSYTNPYIIHTGISNTSSIYYRTTNPWQNSESDFRLKAMGLGLNFNIPTSEYAKISFGSSFERNEIFLQNNMPISYRNFIYQYGGKTNAFILSIGWSKDKRDSILVPKIGSYTQLRADFSTMDLQYCMLTGSHQYYVPIMNNYILAVNSIIDYGISYGNKDFPAIKHVYGGGIGTVRGYAMSSLGPQDSRTGTYLGSSKRIIANLQLYLPFFSSHKDGALRFFLFSDAGRIYGNKGNNYQKNDIYNQIQKPIMDSCNWRFSVGIGLSWQSPLGPMQISYGYPINNKENDKIQNFQFQIGTGF